MKLKELILKSVMAGLLIAFAGWIYLRCENKIVGAFLFSVGLISVILLQANLFTGKVGYIDNKQKLLESIIILLVNLVIAFLVGLLYKYVIGYTDIFQSRTDKTWYRILFDGIGCGMLIYLAVELYKKSNNIIVIILPVVAFILAGMEHSIADAFYLGIDFSLKGLLYLLLVIAGNSIGSLLLRRLQLLYLKENK